MFREEAMEASKESSEFVILTLREEVVAVSTES